MENEPEKDYPILIWGIKIEESTMVVEGYGH